LASTVDGLKPLELHLASVVDAERARLLAVREDHLEVGPLNVGAVRGDEALDIAAPSRPDGSQTRVSVGSRPWARVMKSRGMAERKAPGLRAGKARSGAHPNPPGLRREY
jgi:hypothetical protein